MESFAIHVDVCTEPEYSAIEGFVLEPDRRAIVANWIGADGIWHVGVTDNQHALCEYGDAVGYVRTTRP